NPGLAAFSAFAHLSQASSFSDASRFLDLMSSSIQREPNHYRPTDDGHARALVGIARAHRELQRVAGQQLAEAIVADPRMAQVIFQTDGEELLCDPNAMALLSAAAQGGNLYAGLALVLTSAEIEAVVPLAEERWTSALEPRAYEEGTMTFGTNFVETA